MPSSTLPSSPVGDDGQGIISSSSLLTLTVSLHVFSPLSCGRVTVDVDTLLLVEAGALPCGRVDMDVDTVLLVEAGVKDAASGFNILILWLPILSSLLPLKQPFF